MRVSLPMVMTGFLPFSSFKTAAMALPVRNARSAVRFSPTTPRMPSVPNSFPMILIPLLKKI
jgi:hypothetical protein